MRPLHEIPIGSVFKLENGNEYLKIAPLPQFYGASAALAAVNLNSYAIEIFPSSESALCRAPEDEAIEGEIKC